MPNIFVGVVEHFGHLGKALLRSGDVLPRDILPRDVLPRDFLPRDVLPLGFSFVLYVKVVENTRGKMS